jgi:hypothetical protein
MQATEEATLSSSSLSNPAATDITVTLGFTQCTTQSTATIPTTR